MRDFDLLMRSLGGPFRGSGSWREAALVSIVSGGLILPTLLQPAMGFGYGLLPGVQPEKACDWIEQHGVRGRSFNTFAMGGYMLWRFWPDRDRLPFMDIHQAGTPRIRYVYAYALQDTLAWRTADREWRFDWVLLPRVLPSSPSLLDVLDADSTWSLVFQDDAATLWLRRDGSNGTLARSAAYHRLPAGSRAWAEWGPRIEADPLLRREVWREVQRGMTESPRHGAIARIAANLCRIEGRRDDAVRHLRTAAELLPFELGIREQLGLAWLENHEPLQARRAFQAEQRIHPGWRFREFREGQVLAALGDRSGARKRYEQALRRMPDFAEARDSLAVD